MCLRSVMASDYPNFQVIVIDNNSGTDPGDVILKEFANVQYIHNSNNLGYTGANNQGMSIALEQGADYVWLLNNDSTVQRDAISQLVDCMESDPDLGMSSPVLFDSSPGNANYYGGFMNFDIMKDTRAKTAEEFLDKFMQNPQEVVLVGAALLIRTAALKEVGFFDERFFAYFEDFDLSLRMAQAGWQNTVCFSAFVEHQNSKPDRLPHYYYYMARNGLLFVQKHAPRRTRGRFTRKWFANNITKAANYLVKSKKEDSDAILDGIWNAIKREFGPYEQRQPIPSGLKTILLWHPYFIAKLISF